VQTRAYGTAFEEEFAIYGSGIYLRGKGALGIEQVGTLSAACVAEVTTNAVNTSANPLAVASTTFTLTSPHLDGVEGCLLVNLDQAAPAAGAAPGGGPPQLGAGPGLPAAAHAPALPQALVGNGSISGSGFNANFYFSLAVGGNCPSTPSAFPTFTYQNMTLSQADVGGHINASTRCLLPADATGPAVPPVFTANGLARTGFDGPATPLQLSVLEGFSPDGYVTVVAQGLYTSTRCALAATPVPPPPPAAGQAMQQAGNASDVSFLVVFGDPSLDFVDACGWYRQIGYNLSFVFNNPDEPVRVANATSICPTVWSDAAATTLANYFTPLPTAAPSPSISASPSVTPSSSRTGTASPSATASPVSPSVTPSPGSLSSTASPSSTPVSPSASASTTPSPSPSGSASASSTPGRSESPSPSQPASPTSAPSTRPPRPPPPALDEAAVTGIAAGASIAGAIMLAGAGVLLCRRRSRAVAGQRRAAPRPSGPVRDWPGINGGGAVLNPVAVDIQMLGVVATSSAAAAAPPGPAAGGGATGGSAAAAGLGQP
jgi:hypothetical protein